MPRPASASIEGRCPMPLRVAVFRAATFGPGHTSAFVLSFGPIEADEARGVSSSGPHPWKTAEVPYGSRVDTDWRTGETFLHLPGETRPLTAAEVVRRFGS